MVTPELIVLSLNLTVALLAYFVAYPMLCGDNLVRIAANDLLATGTVLLVAGMLYAGRDHAFDLLVFSTNWFWFAFITYAAVETPLMIRYFNKRDLWSKF
ncbi:hypothetical protein [Pseudohongiella sp.]|uniref:Uncharacterized protein n=1 Tax=marine sediment metagenome TaxID=412755 RepID=A0A0F9VH90_9ZZZZ|nr:hypothetical protein [Pseudohongiella sp.]HDZ08834.1 hypothetical protein [Pseudohongiella sp.]HEA62811.1 hypothetical protein [Pseudohongiella sp.]